MTNVHSLLNSTMTTINETNIIMSTTPTRRPVTDAISPTDFEVSALNMDPMHALSFNAGTIAQYDATEGHLNRLVRH